MASVSNESTSTLPPCQGSSLVVEAQRLMTLSVNKIVASRSRRGGVSLHRNLLVAGVLFRARDALLAVGGKMSQSPSSTASSATSGTSPSETKLQQPDKTSDDTCRTSSIPSSPPSADSPTSTTAACVGSVVTETKPCPHREIPVDSEDDQMDVAIAGKENVPPTATTPSASSDFSKSSADSEPLTTFDKAASQQQGAPVSRKRSHSGSSTSCPIVEKSAKVVSSSESSYGEGRSSSVQVCVGQAPSKNISTPSSKQSSSSSSQSYSSSSYNRSSLSINPVVYVNRVDVAFCSTSGIGGGVIGSIRPVLVVQVV